MVMMMTGRVLLVCALCVLCCGAAVVVSAADGADGPEKEGKESAEDSGSESPDSQEELLGSSGSVDGRPESAGQLLDKKGGINSHQQVDSVIHPSTGDERRVEEKEKEKEGDKNVSGALENLKKDEETSPLPSNPPEGVGILPPPIPPASNDGHVDGIPADGGIVGNVLLSPPSAGTSRQSPNPTVGDNLQNTGVASFNQENKSSGTGKQLGPTTAGTTLPKVDVQKVSIPASEQQRDRSASQDAARNHFFGGGETENEADRSDVATEGPSKQTPGNQTLPQIKTTPEPPTAPPSQERPHVKPQEELSPTPDVPAEGKSLPAPRVSRTPTEETHKTPLSETNTEPETKLQPLKDEVQEQNGSPTNQSHLLKNAATDRLAETTASSISKIGSDDAQRPSSNEPQDGSETANTDVALTVGEAAPQTAKPVTVAQANDTGTPGDSDSSTAVSHTTSPPLLLVVACVAAAVVAA
ncbi:Mucin-associated surface protein (MASP), subgroup S082 [Trypanosoma cruzi]|uniref:Mucin-associated surface protein (MASP) subgroup S082 n=1 Tax=Trypanosoma cruzi TaxID=5693 RepID=A0A7J6XTG0_TRYCR|nr:Mucin-associated surface protein (MASP) subgroup S082 [Trypanosoma cruzi]KAF8275830.1 Mucin-associated surface protein (MASP), subgroup S082 [Trypanosoma cruzi]